MERERFLTLKRLMLEFLVEERLRKAKHFNSEFLYRKFSDFTKEEVDFVLWYLQDGGFVRGYEITAKGVDELWKE